MNIRLKVTALVACLFAVLGVAEILVAKSVLIPSFAELERTDARVAMRRIAFSLDSTLDSLNVSATDWGNWADTYRFIQDHNSAFAAENITPIGLRQLNVNVLMIVDLAGNIVESGQLDLNSGQPLDLDFSSRKTLPLDFPLRANLRDGSAAQGLLQTNRGILMLGAAPILNGNGGGPTRGMVIMGRLLSASEVKRLGAQAQANLSMLPNWRGHATEELVEAGTITQVYQPFNDVYGRPIMTLRVDVPRAISLRGHRAVTYASGYLVGAAVIILVLLVLILNRVVLAPLGRITQYAVAIGEGKDLTRRLDLNSSDEIGVLARELDRMVERVGETRRQLVDQSFQAGFAELAKGVLHNLGNAMTPIGVRLSRLRERLRAAPADDAMQAVEELAKGTADAERHGDLEHFVRLACAELASTIKGAQEDVDLISRQTSVVQTALGEQMRATRNEHVIEAVRLPELVAQSLEIVPDACRSRLEIKMDESLRRVGVVRIARTVLRLVLQNFLINASDSVREAGKVQGTLHVSAEIVREGDREQLHLECRDNGVGIAAENLTRVFEKGFSTKSRETNYGIGLHWCANAVAALGGRIWAASEGPGQGASLHVRVPLAERQATAAEAA